MVQKCSLRLEKCNFLQKFALVHLWHIFLDTQKNRLLNSLNFPNFGHFLVTSLTSSIPTFPGFPGWWTHCHKTSLKDWYLNLDQDRDHKSQTRSSKPYSLRFLRQIPYGPSRAKEPLLVLDWNCYHHAATEIFSSKIIIDCWLERIIMSE